jgi:hypothetical protein
MRFPAVPRRCLEGFFDRLSYLGMVTEKSGLHSCAGVAFSTRCIWSQFSGPSVFPVEIANAREEPRLQIEPAEMDLEPSLTLSLPSLTLSLQ